MIVDHLDIADIQQRFFLRILGVEHAVVPLSLFEKVLKGSPRSNGGRGV